MAEVEILGLGCRFPESTSALNFWNNLFRGSDLLTADARRWDVGLFDTPPRFGKVPDLDRFDSAFFSLFGRQLQKLDPMQRKLLEVSYEAVMDAGINIDAIRGSDRVGVYIGAMSSESKSVWIETAPPPEITGYELLGCGENMLANRLSYFYDIHGPSVVVDTACSSSLMAVQAAVNDIKAGNIDLAFVGGCSAIFSPTGQVGYVKLHIVCPDASVKSFDASANGTVRSEGMGLCIIARKGLDIPGLFFSPKHVYADILAVRANNDGYTPEGVSFPNREQQARLSKATCEQAGINPLDVVYLEAHGTGTTAGDGEELRAIDKTYGAGAGRTPANPLLIGSVKSNMGHTEACAGIASTIKMCLALEHGMLPPNLNYTTPNPKSDSLKNGIFKVVTQPTPLHGGVIAISSFGIGGSNCHIILRSPRCPHFVSPEKPLALTTPMVLPLMARTEAGMNRLIEAVEKYKDKVDLRAPLYKACNILPTTKEAKLFVFRGSVITGGARRCEQVNPRDPPPVWFAFCGNGSQWGGMGVSLIKENATFKKTIQDCSKILERYGWNLFADMESGIEWTDPWKALVALVALQCGLVNVYRQDYGIEPAGIVGHSAGEVACGYCDGCLTLEETILVAYARGKAAPAAGVTGYMMAAVGISAADCEERIKKYNATGVNVACDNGRSSATLSGPKDSLTALCAALEKEGLFVRPVNTNGVPYHSPFLAPALPAFKHDLDEIIKEPKLRSSRWLSAVFHEGDTSPAALHCGPEYQLQSYAQKVILREALEKLPKEAVILEVGPEHILRHAIKQTLNDTAYVPSMRKGECGLATVSNAIAYLWSKGVPMKWQEPAGSAEALEAAGGLPHEIREAMVSWDHSKVAPMPIWDKDRIARITGPLPTAAPAPAPAAAPAPAPAPAVVAPSNPALPAPAAPKRTAGDRYVKVWDLNGVDSFIKDHIIDGRLMMPATSYIVAAWEAFADRLHKPMSEVAVEWEDIHMHNAVIAAASSTVTFTIDLDSEGNFKVFNYEQLCCSGSIRQIVAANVEDPGPRAQPEWPHDEGHTVDHDTLYRRLRLNGYHFGPEFSLIQKQAADEKSGLIKWNMNWVSFFDGLLQLSGWDKIGYNLRLPITIRRITCFAPAGLPASRVIKAEMDWATSTTTCMLAETCDMHLMEVGKASDKKSKALVPTVEYQSFMPYGRQTADAPERLKYAKALCGFVRETLLDYLDQPGMAPHFRKVRDLLQLLPGKEVGSDELPLMVSAAPNVLGRIVNSGLNPRTIVEFVRNPKKFISGHKESSKMWTDDVLLSGFGEDELRYMIETVAENVNDKYKVLEVGCSDGSFTKACLPLVSLTVLAKPSTYLATDYNQDMAHLFMSEASTLSPIVGYNNWDLNDAVPAHVGTGYSLVVARNAFHKASNLSATLGRLASTLVDGGFLLFYEVTSPLLACLYGLEAECRWNATDKREYGDWAASNTWLRLLELNGLQMVRMVRCPADVGTLFLARKVPAKLPPPLILAAPKVYTDKAEMQAWMAEYKKVCNAAIDAGADQRVLLVGNLNDNAGLTGMVRCMRLEPGGQRVRCVYNADEVPVSDLIADARMVAALKLDLVMNVFTSNGRHGVYRRQELRPSKFRTQGWDELVHGARVGQERPGDLATIGWVDNCPSKPDPTWIKCGVTYAALNSKDYVVATGQLAKQYALLEIGAEFAGFVDDEEQEVPDDPRFGLGARVMGIAPNALATHTFAPMYTLWAVPDEWSDAEAATVPVNYAMSYYVISICADLQLGQRFFVHSGLYPMGQAMIRLALARGAEVFTTVASGKERRQLQKLFPQLDDSHIGSCLSTSFEQLILRQTNGKGVHVAVNFLAEPDKAIASIRCLSPHGVYIDMTLSDPNKPTLPPKAMHLLLKNHIRLHSSSDIENMFFGAERREDIAWRTHQLMVDGIEAGEVVPIQPKVYPRDAIKEALKSFAESDTTVYKRVINVNDDSAGPLPTLSVATKLYMRSDRSYLLIGGLGGFGLAVIEWLFDKGARNIVVTSRSGVSSGSQLKLIEALKRRGCTVLVSKLDVSKEDQARELVKVSEGLAPLGGVFCMAMVLRDMMLMNHTGQSWCESTCVKTLGTNYLDAITREIPTVEHFITFSSVSAGHGNAGQTSYAFGNTTMDEIARVRREHGFPALSVQWGIIGDVGFLAEKSTVGTTLPLLPQPIINCLELLETTMARSTTLPPIVVSYVSRAIEAWKAGQTAKDAVAKQQTIPPATAAPAPAPVRRPIAITLDQVVERDERPLARAFERNLTLAPVTNVVPPSSAATPKVSAADGMLKGILTIIGVPEDQVHASDTLSDLGMDSMQMVEVRGLIEKATGEPPALESLTRMTIAELRKLEKDAVSVTKALPVARLPSMARPRQSSGSAPAAAPIPASPKAPAAAAPAPAAPSAAAGMVKAILEVIGVAEGEAHATDTLSDLGMDSMQMVEVRGLIEKATGEPPALETLTRMTIAELRKMEKAAGPAPAPPAPPAPPALVMASGPSMRLGARPGSIISLPNPPFAMSGHASAAPQPVVAPPVAATAGMLKAILEVIGVAESEAHGTDTLSDLGMDSMQMVEVRGIIERSTGEPPQLETLTRMTIAEIKKMEAKSAVAASVAVAPAAAAAFEATPDALTRIGSRRMTRPNALPSPRAPSRGNLSHLRPVLPAAMAAPVAAAPSAAAGMVKAILEVIGVAEDEAHATDTLSDLGMDSMQMVEVRGLIEKATGEPPQLETLTRMTIAELRKMEKAAAGPAASGGLAGVLASFQPANALQSDDPFSRGRGRIGA